MIHLHPQTCPPQPPPCRVARALTLVGELLGVAECLYRDGSFYFSRGDDGRSISIRPESAGRFRVVACGAQQPRATLWSRDGDDDHLAGIVLELAALTQSSDEILEESILRRS